VSRPDVFLTPITLDLAHFSSTTFDRCGEFCLQPLLSLFFHFFPSDHFFVLGSMFLPCSLLFGCPNALACFPGFFLSYSPFQIIRFPLSLSLLKGYSIRVVLYSSSAIEIVKLCL
jgi:hypothetical protein